ncbi:MAG: hypothetical protein ACI8PT_000795 [Gammaproteobacteria bacterium]
MIRSFPEEHEARKEILVEVMSFPMDDVRQWLDSLGLSQYGEAFEDSAVEWRHLPMLDNDALKEFGVSAMGYRMPLVEAIWSLDAGAQIAERT